MSVFSRFYQKCFKTSVNDVIEITDSKYVAQINDNIYWFDTKDQMLKAISDYGQKNVIYSLSMFRHDIFNLLK